MAWRKSIGVPSALILVAALVGLIGACGEGKSKPAAKTTTTSVPESGAKRREPRAKTGEGPTHVEVTASSASLKVGTKIIATLREGQCYRILKTQGNWFQISAYGRKGWVHAKNLAPYGGKRRARVAKRPSGVPAQPKRIDVRHTILRQWKPMSRPGGLGADVLLEQDVNVEQLVRFVEQLARAHDPVIIRVFTSREAYADQDGTTPAFQTGFLIFYVKNGTGRGPYRGFNEIRWMQEVGKFSSRFGQKTKL